MIEKWEAYMLPNHSCFGAIAEEHFLEGTNLLSSLEKINSSFLRREFRKDCRRFLEDFVSTIISTVAARSPVGQGLSCFCPEIVIGGDDYSAFHLFGQLLDGLLELGWVRGSKVAPAKAEFHSFFCVSSDKWKQTAIDPVRRSTACLPFAVSPVSVLGGICTKLVLLCFKVISIFSWSNTSAALDLPVDSISGEGSCRAASPLYCRWMGLPLTMRRWTGQWRVCRILCVIPCLHREAFLWDWDQHAEHCCHCRRCCSKQCYVWPLGSFWCRSWPRSCRFEVLPRESYVTEEGDEGYTGALVQCRNRCLISCRWAIRISDVVEVRDVQYVAEHEKLGLHCCCKSASSPGKSKRRRAPVSPGVTKKQFSVSSPSASRPSIESALQENLEKSGREEVVAIAVMPQFSKGDTNNNLIVHLYKLLAFRI